MATLLLVALSIELRTTRIPNWLTLVGLVSGIVLAVFDNLWALHGTGFVLGLILGVGLYVRANAGAGLTKLLAAVGTVIGPVIPITTVFVTVVVQRFSALARRSSPPPELQYEGERRRDSVSGSILVSIGTVIGVALLYQPLK